MAYEGDAKSLITLSSKSEGSSALTRAKWRNAPLHERCSIYDMVRIKTAFQEAYENKFLKNEFRNLLRTLLNVEYDDDDYNILFMKINTNRNGEITWDELVSHLLLGFFADDPENQRESMQLPIMGLPTMMRSQHRHPISRICFCPEVSKFRTTDPMQGTYLTASRDGMINWWSLDMTYLRTAFSSSPHLKVRTTWVTDMVCMPDINIVVTSSTERDLRFYDCAAKTFTLKIIITSWEYMICTMHYHFEEDIKQECMLILGDVGGNVRLLRFSPEGRGPFKNEAGRALIQLRKVDLAKQLPELRLVEIGRVHSEWVRQVSYYSTLHCVVSCATCAQSLLMCDAANTTHSNMFSTDKGIQCFAFDERAHVLVTGGPDCEVRVWNPFVPTRATVVLGGHHAAVIAIVLQNHGQTIYSMARDRAIKVWDVQAQVCVQTYIDIPACLGSRTPVSAAYNEGTRELVLAAAMIARVTLDEALGARHTDGITHSRAITAVLYNPLFKVLVTCGMDSIIVNWDPISGKRNVMIRDAHTRLLRGELIPVEITSACFDPGHQLLLTGARDGTLKVWNFNTGVNLRCMSIEHMCEVTSVFWIEGRILAVGWNRHVTEFEDSGTSSTGKAWDTRHRDDVLAAACHVPYSLATVSYNSELVLWKLDTGQPYRMFSCTDPMLRIKLKYSKRDARTTTPTPVARRQSTISIPRPSSVGLESSDAIRKARARRASSVALAQHDTRAQPRQLAAHATLFLQTRPCCMHTASFMVSLENGMVQGWSDHPAGGYKGAFQGVHTLGDYVSAMATDEKNEYLFAGTTVGYIKTFLMTNYLVNEKVHVNMPRIRLEFPFLLRDRIEGRAKRSVRDQPQPLLLNSYRGHMRCVTTIAYIDELKILLTGSSDYSVRVWRLSGEYLQTLGGLVPYTLLETRMPPDVRKVASFTTLKVWRGGYVSRYVPGQVQVDELRDITERELQTKTFGAPAPEPLLGNYFKLPSRPDRQDPIKLDDSLPTIPLYCQLRLARSQPVRRPATPPRVAQTRLRNDNARRHHTRH